MSKTTTILLYLSCKHGTCIKYKHRTRCARVKGIRSFPKINFKRVVAVVDLNKCLKQIKLPISPHMCAPSAEQLYDMHARGFLLIVAESPLITVQLSVSTMSKGSRKKKVFLVASPFYLYHRRIRSLYLATKAYAYSPHFLGRWPGPSPPPS